MARTINQTVHTIRREAFVDPAQRLIQAKGFEQMSVQDVLDELDASRGAFHHYFDSKVALLEAVVERMVVGGMAALEPILADPHLSAVEKLRRLFAGVNQFKAYLGWSPQLTRSGSSVDHSELAKTGVRPARNVLGQMTVIMLSPTIRATPFREVYQRLTGRGMRPAAALGHVAGKLSVVLYGMLKNMTPYDQDKHRRQLGLVQSTDQGSLPVDISLEVVDLAESGNDLLADAVQAPLVTSDAGLLNAGGQMAVPVLKPSEFARRCGALYMESGLR